MVYVDVSELSQFLEQDTVAAFRAAAVCTWERVAGESPRTGTIAFTIWLAVQDPTKRPYVVVASLGIGGKQGRVSGATPEELASALLTELRRLVSTPLQE